jgi:8-oxo-dGTP pyrophosphatase MutT (NUDIX family)
MSNNLTLIDGGKPDLKEVDCAGAVILLGRGMIVLVRPLNGRDEWLLPKGHVEGDESSIQAAAREALEETGSICTPEDGQPIKVTSYDDLAREERKTTTWYLLRAAALKTERAEVLTDRTASRREIGIFPSIVALSRLTYQEHRDVLATVLGGSMEEA